MIALCGLLINLLFVALGWCFVVRGYGAFGFRFAAVFCGSFSGGRFDYDVA